MFLQRLVCTFVVAALSLVVSTSLAVDPVPAAPAPAAAPELRVGTLKANKVLFLGNSITLHGPLEAIGWSGNWGMAASAEHLDYVHLTLAHLAKTAGGQSQVMVKNIADFERDHATYDIAMGMKEALEFQADIIIVAIGENVPALATIEAQEKYEQAFAKLLETLHHPGQPAIFVRSNFWTDPAKNDIMAKCCTKGNDTYVDLGELDKNEANFARAERKIEHAGVAAHPGDQGMLAIATAICKAIDKRAGLLVVRP